MSNLVKIHNVEIQVKEYENKRVCTFKDIDYCHSKAEGQTRVAFNRHRKHFIPNEDYFVLNRYEADKQGFTAPNGIIYITESGYLMITKTFEDDLAWDVQRQLVNNYFRKPAPEPKPKTKKQELEEKYLDALKTTDQCKDVKEYHYSKHLEHERDYRKYLKMENDWHDAAEYYKNEIRKLANQDMMDGLLTITGNILANI